MRERTCDNPFAQDEQYRPLFSLTQGAVKGTSMEFETTSSAAAAAPRGFSATSGLTRNRAFACQLATMAAVSLAIVLAAAFFSSVSAAAWAACTGAACCLLFVAFSLWRYREISRLAAEVDEVLHGGRRVSFSDCREGDVAVLRTEISKMIARLARTSEQLQSEKTALADALADISHQIRTPLTAMSLLVPVAERAADDVARRSALRELDGMVERVSWLVTTLLKLARIDAGVMRLERRQAHVADVAARALAPLELSLDVRGIACSVNVGESTFEGDEAWTAEALENIVKNCAEATGSGGSVRIEASEDALATRIRVSDNGPGIAPEDLPHVFERFYRGSRLAATADSSANSQGFGVGLSLAQALISAQGGSLRARNLAEGGACFEITFPKMNV